MRLLEKTNLISGSLTIKIVATIVLVTLILFTFLGLNQIKNTRYLLKEAFDEKVMHTATMLDANIDTIAFLNDKTALFELFTKQIWIDPDILKIDLHVPSEESVLNVHVSSNSRRNGKIADRKNIDVFNNKQVYTNLYEDSELDTLQVITSISVSKRRIGTIDILFTCESINKALRNSVRDVASEFLLVALFLSSALSLLLFHFIVKPVRLISTGLRDIGKGSLVEVGYLKSKDEIGRLVREFNELVRKLVSAEDRINKLAYFDQLTNLPNRRLFEIKLVEVLKNIESNKYSCAVFYLDLDMFKGINDLMGHNIGDGVLKVIASRIKECVKESDVVARIGGDEFVILISNIPIDYAIIVNKIARRVLETSSEPCTVRGVEVRTSVSIGIRVITEVESNFNSIKILQEADMALYHAKSMGGDSYHVFQNKMLRSFTYRLDIQNNLRRAIKNKEFVNYYQPQFDGKLRIVGFESLLRWNHPELGEIMPIEFIHIAEETGIISELGEVALENAIADFLEILKSGLISNKTSLIVNISPRQLADNNIVARILGVVKKYDMPPDQLELEITESAEFQELDKAIKKVKELEEQRIGFTLDDFGIGYSSLNHLRKFPVGKIKIDRSFINDIESDERNYDTVDTILDVAKRHNKLVVVEGVETAHQLKLLKDRGCHYFQGFYLSKPLDKNELLDFLLNRKKH